MITVPAHQSLWSYFDEASCHCRRYELEELRTKCTGVGFEIEYATEFMASIYPLLRAQRRWAGKRQQATGATPIELAKRELAINPFVNIVLDQLTRLETGLIRRRKQLPRGTSILAIARKP